MVTVLDDSDAVKELRRPRKGDGEEDDAVVAAAAGFMALPNMGRCGCAAAAADALMSAADRPDAEEDDDTETEGKDEAADDEAVSFDLRRSNKEDEEDELDKLDFEISRISSLSSIAIVAGANGATLRRAIVTGIGEVDAAPPSKIEGDEDEDDDEIAEDAESEDESEDAVNGDCLTAARELGMGISMSSPKRSEESDEASAEAAVDSGFARFALAPVARGSSSSSSAMLSILLEWLLPPPVRALWLRSGDGFADDGVVDDDDDDDDNDNDDDDDEDDNDDDEIAVAGRFVAKGDDVTGSGAANELLRDRALASGGGGLRDTGAAAGDSLSLRTMTALSSSTLAALLPLVWPPFLSTESVRLSVRGSLGAGAALTRPPP